MSSDGEADRRRQASPGVRDAQAERDTGPNPGSNAPPAGPLSGPLWYEERQTPLSCLLTFVHPIRDRSRNPLVPLRFARILPNRTLRLWAERGAGSDPLRSNDLRPRNSPLVTPGVSCSGSLSAHACSAIYPFGKASNPFARGCTPAARAVSDGGAALHADEGIEPQLAVASDCGAGGRLDLVLSLESKPRFARPGVRADQRIGTAGGEHEAFEPVPVLRHSLVRRAAGCCR